MFIFIMLIVVGGPLCVVGVGSIANSTTEVPTAMASIYSNSTTEGYDHFRNDSINNSVHGNFKVTSSSWIDSMVMFHFILFTVVAGPMCVVGFVANIICYNILKRERGKKHRAATFLLQALAVADNLVLTFFFFNLSIVLGLLPKLGVRESIISDVIFVYIRVYVVPFVSMAYTATVWITVLIAINRYIAVCRPLDAHRLVSLKNTKIQVAMVSTLAIVFSLPPFFQYTIVYLEEYDSISVPSIEYTSIGPGTVFDMICIIMFDIIGRMIIPLMLLIILNSKIIWELRKAGKSRDVIRQNGSRSENSITMVMVVIIIVFLVCNIPHPIYLVLWYTDHHSHYTVWCVSNVFLVTNSSTNFLVYYVLRKSFRRAFRKALCCCQPEALVV